MSDSINGAEDRDLIRVSDLAKIYDEGGPNETAVFRDLSFSIRAGEFVTVVGQSGCGKSTLLLVLAGLLDPSSGSVTMEGEPIEGPRPDDIGVVFQEYTLFPWKTLLENVAFPLRLQGIPADKRRERARRYIELVDLAGDEASRPNELSGGMKQRAAISRSLVQEPDVLLMDEPLGALDEQTRMDLQNELLRIWRETEQTIVFITHDLREAVYLSDRVFVMGEEPDALEAFDIELERPRSRAVFESPRFGELQNQLWDAIRATAE